MSSYAVFRILWDTSAVIKQAEKEWMHPIFLFCVTNTDRDVESKGVGRCGTCTYLKASLYYPVMELRFRVVHFKYLYIGRPSPSGRFSTYPFGAFLIWDRGRQPHSWRTDWSSGRTVGHFPLRDTALRKAAQFGPRPPCSGFGEIVLVLFCLCLVGMECVLRGFKFNLIFVVLVRQKRETWLRKVFFIYLLN